MKLLALSTSTPRGSAALFEAADVDLHAEAAASRGGALSTAGLAAAPAAGARLLAATTYADLHGHAERIFGAVDEVLAAAGLPAAAVQALGCDVGPGSFTGVRVAVAAAKGVALALDVPVAGVTSLEAMAAAAFAAGAASPGNLLVPLIDAKKGEVFLAAFDAPAAAPSIPPRHLPRDAAFDVVAELAAGRRIVVVGAVAEEIEALRPLAARGDALDFPDAAFDRAPRDRPAPGGRRGRRARASGGPARSGAPRAALCARAGREAGRAGIHSAPMISSPEGDGVAPDAEREASSPSDAERAPPPAAAAEPAGSPSAPAAPRDEPAALVRPRGVGRAGARSRAAPRPVRPPVRGRRRHLPRGRARDRGVPPRGGARPAHQEGPRRRAQPDGPEARRSVRRVRAPRRRGALVDGDRALPRGRARARSGHAAEPRRAQPGRRRCASSSSSCGRLRDAEDQIEIMMLTDTQSKVVNALLKLAQQSRATGGAASNGASFAISPMELSTRVGLDVDTVKRAVQQLREGQYLRVADERLEIPDIEALRRLFGLLGLKDEIRGEQ